MANQSTGVTQSQEKTERPRMARHTKIFIGLIAGALAGVVSNKFFIDAPALGVVQKYLSDPLGKIFLNLLIMVVVIPAIDCEPI